MILTVTLNPAVDITYVLDAVRWNETNRVAEVLERGGGKGVNVATVLHALGEPVAATGLAGGDAGRRVRSDVTAAGVRESFAEIAGATRRTVAVVAHGGEETTMFNEPGPAVSSEEWAQFAAKFPALLRGVRVVTFSGSLPPGVPEDAYAELGRVCRSEDVPFVVDAGGAPLRLALSARPAAVKPNLDELEATTGSRDVTDGASALRRAGAEAVLVSAGPHGLVADTTQGAWACRPPRRVDGNPTGAGDSVVAAVARGLARSASWPEILGDAVALSAATVAAAVAGAFDVSTYRQIAAAAEVRALPR